MAHDKECCYAECHLCWVSFMLSIMNKPFMPSISMLNFIIMSVIMISVVAPLCISREALLKGKAQCTTVDLFARTSLDHLLIKLQTVFTFLQNKPP